MKKKKAGPAKPANWAELELNEKKAWCHANKVIDWDIHKVCKEHGLTYLYLRDFFHGSQTGTCAHPKCTSKQISALRYSPKCGGLLRFADRLCGREALIDETQMTILTQIKQGRPTIIHGSLMRWIALACLKRLKKVEEKDKKATELKEAITAHLLEEAGVIINSNMSSTSNFGSSFVSYSGDSPEKLLSTAEQYFLVAQEFGPGVLMWLLGELNTREIARVEGCKIREVESIRERVKQFYIKMFDSAENHHERCAL